MILISAEYCCGSAELWYYRCGFGMVDDLNDSILAKLGSAIAWIYAPLGWGQIAEIATITGLIAKKTLLLFGVLFGFEKLQKMVMEQGTLFSFFTPAAAYSFLVFNLLCALALQRLGQSKEKSTMRNGHGLRFFTKHIFAYLDSCVYINLVPLSQVQQVLALVLW